MPLRTPTRSLDGRNLAGREQPQKCASQCSLDGRKTAKTVMVLREFQLYKRSVLEAMGAVLIVTIVNMYLPQ